MKSILRKSAAALAVLAVSSAIPEASAAKIRLEGYGFYKLGSTDKYRPSGAKQSGRYKNLGSDYYHSATIRMDYVTNFSNSRSGNLSFELWAMPYYGASSGPILMTKALDTINGGGTNSDVSKKGQAISLDQRRFPDINIWEYTRNGWKFRDALTFTRKTLM